MNVNTLSSHSSCRSSAGPVLVTCIVCSSSDMCPLPQPEAASRDEVSEGEAARVRERPAAGVKTGWRSTRPSCFRPLFTHSAAGSKAPSHVWSLALALPGVWGIVLRVWGNGSPLLPPVTACVSPQLPEPTSKCLWQLLWLLE